MLMRINLGYGEGYLPIEMESNAAMIKPAPVLDSLTSEQALNNWFQQGSLDISEVESIAMVVDQSAIHPSIQDIITRLLTQIESSPHLDRINIIASEKNEIWRHDLLDDPRISSVIHDPTEDGNHEFVGETPTYSTPVSMACEYLQSDIKIGVGAAVLDPIVGCTGGPVSVLRNTATEKTILRNERLGATRLGAFYAADSAPRTDALEAATLTGLDLIFNAFLGHDYNIDFFAAGSPESTSSSCFNTMVKRATVPMKHCADIAIVSQGGYPYDSTLYSSIGSLVSGYLATVHGGAIVLVSECSQGPGPSGFIDGVSECESEEEVVVSAESQYHHGMNGARLFWRVLSSRKIIICSRLRESLVTERLRSFAVRDPDEGLETAKSMLTSKSRIVVLPQGHSTIPAAPK